MISCADDEIAYSEGGYPYPTKITGQDSNFYFLPIQKLIGRRDSIIICQYAEIYSGFNEPNLSIGPPKEDIFRFALDGWSSAMITLTKDKIIIKEPTSGFHYDSPNENVLDSIERLHYDLFDVQFRLSDERFPVWRKRYIDSLLKVYPKLFDPAYYLKLQSKVFSIKRQFEYTRKETRITNDQFKHIIKLINESGYWKSPYYRMDCSIMDGEGIFFESITKEKYQSIFYKLCPEDTSGIRKAYNEVLKTAGVEDGKLGRQDSVSRWSTTEKVEVRELKLTEGKPESRSKKKNAQ